VAACAGPSAGPAVLAELRSNIEKARSEYDAKYGESLIPTAQALASANPSDVAAQFALADLAVVIAEMIRMDYENNDTMEMRDKRLLGRHADEIAEIGLATLRAMPDSSEKFRMMSDLYATMIRSKFQGKKYSDNMDNSARRALELDPSNANAYVTACKRMLFAKPKYGGDVGAALAMLGRAIELDPKNVRAHIFRGLAWEKLGDVDKAVKDWEEALAIDPKCAPGLDHIKRVKDKDMGFEGDDAESAEGEATAQE
jgi:cytochrome c-type biogenesis protein CcmH/NrfG